MATEADWRWMQRAIGLAAQALGRTSPNPVVGCVLVKDGEVVGEGFHHAAGRPHAEVEALTLAGDQAKGSTAYVTLEPCAHHGRTGPCVDALVAARVARVVVAHLDPNPKVGGQGAARLREHQIAVEVGLCEAQARSLNQPYLKWIKSGRPFVTLKAAVSLDGRTAVASRASGWLSSRGSREEVHRWRDRSDVILVGGETIRRDDPQLTTRLPEQPDRRDPKRVVVSGRLDLPIAARALDDALIFAATQHATPSAKVDALRSRGAEIIGLPGDAAGRIDLAVLLDELGRRGYCSVLCEGGATLHGQLVASRLADRLAIFVAPLLLGSGALPLLDWVGGAALSEAPRLHRIQHRRFEDDLLIEGDFSPQLH